MAAPGADGLLEREVEIEQLRRSVDDSRGGRGRLVVIAGPAGIGKTTLLAAAQHLARCSEMQVRAARGSELEQSFAFGVVRQLLDPLVSTGTRQERREWFAGAAELAEPLFGARGLAQDIGGEDSIYPRLYGLYWLCANLARVRPLAFCLDDAQWADEPSLAWLGFIARRSSELPLLLVVAARSDDAGRLQALTALSTDPAARVLRPRGLTVRAVQQMLYQRMGGGAEEGFATACHDATAGNPFLVRELLQDLVDRGIAPLAQNAADVAVRPPPAIADAVLGRLARHSPAALLLAQAVAVLGDGATLANAAATRSSATCRARHSTRRPRRRPPASIPGPGRPKRRIWPAC